MFVLAAVIGCERAQAPALSDTMAMSSTGATITPALSSTAQIESATVRTVSVPLQAEVPVATAAPEPRSGADAGLDVLRSELIIPVSGVVAGELRDTFTEARGNGRVHDAIDIPAPRNTPVLAATNGRVLKLFTSRAGGLMVYAADSSERFIMMYGHLDGYAPGLADGSRLTRGQTIGFVGTTGNAPPNLPHLHFAIARAVDISRWWQGTAVNPYPLLKTR